MAFNIIIEGGFCIASDNASGEEIFRRLRANTTFEVNTTDVFQFFYNTPNPSGQENRFPLGGSQHFLSWSDFGTLTVDGVVISVLTARGLATTLSSYVGFFFNPEQWGKESSSNSTTTPLGIGGIFTGVAEHNDIPYIMVSLKTDQNGTLYMEFSDDGTNWDSSIQVPYDITKINTPTPLLKAGRYYRTRFENTSGIAQTYLRLTAHFGLFGQLNSTLNSIVSPTFPASVTRPMDFNMMVSKGLYQGHSMIIKDGITPAFNSAAVPQDLFGLAGIYTGFPAVEAAAEIVVAGADTGTIYYYYLSDATSISYTLGSVAVAGAGTYPLGHSVYRSNYMYFDNGTTINASLITMRLTATPATIFDVISAGYGQSYCAAYTVPQGRKCYIDRTTGSIRKNTGANGEGFFYWKESGRSPILRFPFILNQGSLFFDDQDYAVSIPEGTDFIPRITLNSTNGSVCAFTIRLLEVVD